MVSEELIKKVKKHLSSEIMSFERAKRGIVNAKNSMKELNEIVMSLSTFLDVLEGDLDEWARRNRVFLRKLEEMV